jgi:hypothetical protein
MPRQSLYTFNELMPGNSYIIPSTSSEQFPKIRSAASYFAKKNNIKLICTLLPTGELQVYREGTNAQTERAASAYVPTGSHPSDNLLPFTAPEPIKPKQPAAKPGPTHEQWDRMLANIPADSSITIESDWYPHFTTMIGWTKEFSGVYNLWEATVTNDGKLLVTHKDEVVDMFHNSPAESATLSPEPDNPLMQPDGIEGELPEKASSYEAAITAEAEKLIAQRERAKIAANGDGWTGLPCTVCKGVIGGCTYCSGTGKHYDATQDLRNRPRNVTDMAAEIEDAILHPKKHAGIPHDSITAGDGGYY